MGMARWRERREYGLELSLETERREVRVFSAAASSEQQRATRQAMYIHIGEQIGKSAGDCSWTLGSVHMACVIQVQAPAAFSRRPSSVVSRRDSLLILSLDHAFLSPLGHRAQVGGRFFLTCQGLWAEGGQPPRAPGHL